jgi:tetratricopeptide (TPR) repeat protein
LARLLVYESDHVEAERHLRAVGDSYETIGDESAQVDVLMLLTRVLREQKRFDEGTVTAVRAFRLAARIGDAQRVAGARNNFTYDDLRCGRFEAAHRRLERVAQVFPPGSRYRALVAFNQAETLRLAGREVDARDAYADAIDLFRPFPEPAMKAKAYSRLAMCECLAGSLDAAVAFLAEARRAAAELNGSVQVPDVTLAAGLIARIHGDHRGARRSLRIAMDAFGRQGQEREVVEAGILLVGVALAAERRLVADTVRRLCAIRHFALTELERRVLAGLAN